MVRILLICMFQSNIFVVLVNSGFYVGTYVSLGKTYLKMKNKEDAKKWLTKAVNYKSENEKDDKVSPTFSLLTGCFHILLYQVKFSGGYFPSIFRVIKCLVCVGSCGFDRIDCFS